MFFGALGVGAGAGAGDLEAVRLEGRKVVVGVLINLLESHLELLVPAFGDLPRSRLCSSGFEKAVE